MKRVSIIALAFVMVLSLLSACRSDNTAIELSNAIGKLDTALNYDWSLCVKTTGNEEDVKALAASVDFYREFGGIDCSGVVQNTGESGKIIRIHLETDESLPDTDIIVTRESAYMTVASVGFEDDRWIALPAGKVNISDEQLSTISSMNKQFVSIIDTTLNGPGVKVNKENEIYTVSIPENNGVSGSLVIRINGGVYELTEMVQNEKASVSIICTFDLDGGDAQLPEPDMIVTDFEQLFEELPVVN